MHGVLRKLHAVDLVERVGRHGSEYQRGTGQTRQSHRGTTQCAKKSFMPNESGEEWEKYTVVEAGKRNVLLFQQPAHHFQFDRNSRVLPRVDIFPPSNTTWASLETDNQLDSHMHQRHRMSAT